MDRWQFARTTVDANTELFTTPARIEEERSAANERTVLAKESEKKWMSIVFPVKHCQNYSLPKYKKLEEENFFRMKDLSDSTCGRGKDDQIAWGAAYTFTASYCLEL
jgi:hypothetical protein